MSSRREEQEKERVQKLTAVSNQGSVHRGSNDVDSDFINIYNKEFHLKRSLPTVEITSRDDLVLKDNPALSISILKQFLEKQEIKLTEVGEDE